LTDAASDEPDSRSPVRPDPKLDVLVRRYLVVANRARREALRRHLQVIAPAADEFRGLVVDVRVVSRRRRGTKRVSAPFRITADPRGLALADERQGPPDVVVKLDRSHLDHVVSKPWRYLARPNRLQLC